MTRAEFLQGLKTELEGRVPYSVIQENIRYYDSYILDEVNKGADEAEVIESLGGPKIIARTIVDAALDTLHGHRYFLTLFYLSPFPDLFYLKGQWLCAP